MTNLEEKVLVQLAHSTVVGYYRSQVQHLQRRRVSFLKQAVIFNFLRHLRRNHEEEYKKASGTVRPNQSSLNNYVHRSKKISVWKKEHLDNLLAEMICKDNLPFTILQREGFWNFMSASVPEYKILSYEKMRDTLIPILYAKESCAVKKLLK
jgi:hypothetical protein